MLRGFDRKTWRTLSLFAWKTIDRNGGLEYRRKGLLLIISNDRSADTDGVEAEKMREAGEYAGGIFRESIMAIESGAGAEVGGFVVSRRASGCGLSVLPSAPSRMFSIRSAGILRVFFPFPASRVGESANKWLGRVNGIGEFVEASASRREMENSRIIREEYFPGRE